MTLERLRNYLLDKQEIADLETKTRTVQSNYVMDVVRGSMPDFPYTARTVSVRGLSDDDLNAVSEYAARIAQLKLGCKEVEIWVSNIDDRLTQKIIRLRYMERQGATFKQVAMKIGGGNTEESVKKRVYRMLNM